MIRTMSCLGFSSMVHVTKSESGDDPADWPGFKDRMRKAARGVEETGFVSRECWSPSAFLEHCAAPQRARFPIVAIETAPSAVSIHEFVWPERCTILVGSEGVGIHGKVVATLRPGYVQAPCTGNGGAQVRAFVIDNSTFR